MKELHEALESAFNLLSTVSVSGDNVDKVAVVRQYLRDAYRAAKKLEDSTADANAEKEALDG